MRGLGTLLPFVLIALVFWVLILRPQRKRQQDLRSTQSTLGVGSEVMLGSGIYGRVASLDDETLQLELSPGNQVKVARQAVVRVLDPADPVEDREADLGGGDDEHPGSADPHQ